MRRLLLSALPLLAACTSDIDEDDIPSGTTAPPARIDLVVQDAPADELVAFLTSVEDLRLDLPDGSSTEALLQASVPVEFVGLRDRVLWLASFEVEPATYDAVRLRFTPDSTSARSLSGDELAVEALSELLVAPLAQPLDLDGGEYARIVVDLDLGASLSGDVASGRLTFDPIGSAVAGNGTVPLRIDDLDALVEARDLASGGLAVQAGVADERRLPLRTVVVGIVPATLLIGPNRDIFTQTASYLTLLSPGLAVVEIEGFLGFRGQFLASCIELEDQNGLSGTHFPVEIEGLVVARPQPNLATILVREITRGSEIALPVLFNVGATFDVLVEPSMLVSASDGGLLSMQELPVGAEVEAKFSFFSAEPFQAQRLVLLDTPGEPTSGVEESSSAGGTLVLDTALRPVLSPEDVPAGLRVWRSSKLGIVRAGLLVDGRVRAIDPAARRLSLSAGRIAASFGGHATEGAGPFVIELAPDAHVLGAASDLAGLAELSATLPAGASLVIEVRGLASPTPGTLRAWELRASIVH